MRAYGAAAFAILIASGLPGQPGAPVRPNSRLTPGAVRRGVTRDSVCVAGAATRARAVTPLIKRHVFQAYGIERPPPRRYEIDHLISLELGGSNDPTNLWPESYETRPWNAHVKDALENRLHHLVCSGRLPLAVAQHAIRADWIAAWRRYAAGRLTSRDRMSR